MVKPPKALSKVFVNKSSVTVDDEVGIRYAQRFRYGSPELEAVHTYGRHTIESYNNSVKYGDTTCTTGVRRAKRSRHSSPSPPSLR